MPSHLLLFADFATLLSPSSPCVIAGKLPVLLFTRNADGKLPVSCHKRQSLLIILRLVADLVHAMTASVHCPPFYAQSGLIQLQAMGAESHGTPASCFPVTAQHLSTPERHRDCHLTGHHALTESYTTNIPHTYTCTTCTRTGPRPPWLHWPGLHHSGSRGSTHICTRTPMACITPAVVLPVRSPCRCTNFQQPLSLSIPQT